MGFIKYLAIAIFTSVSLLAFLAVPVGTFLYLVDRAECEAKWIESGAESKHSALGGCRVKLDNGRWVPSSAVRWTDLTGKETK